MEADVWAKDQVFDQVEALYAKALEILPSEYGELRQQCLKARCIAGTRYLFGFASVNDFEQVKVLFQSMINRGFIPNVITYTSLIHRASDYPTARDLLDEMKREGLTPNVITYTSLISRASDYPTARDLLDEMKQAGLTPNESHLSSVAKKITDANQADDLTDWAKRRHLCGLGYFSSLYSVLPYFMSATAILAWHFQTYKKIALRFDQALEATTKAYVQRRQPEEALRVMWAFPHFDSAKRLFRTHFDTCKQCLLENYNNGVEQHHISYALGICFYENGHLEDAKQWLNSAKNNANNQLNKKRMASIENILTAIARRKVGD